MTNDKKKLQSSVYLIDGSSYLYRAYYAIKQRLSNSHGMPTGAVYGIVSMLLKILKEKKPDYIMVVWDAKGPVFRHDIYKDYKANRPSMPEDLTVQVPFVRDVVEAMGISQIEYPGYEADDIIATLTDSLAEESIVIISGDKDLKQLASERTVIWDTMKDSLTSRKTILEENGIEPVQLLEVQALAGDSSDNIPGIQGVGLKTALKLVKKFGTVENLYANLDKLPEGKLKIRLQEGSSDINLWKNLVRLARNVPISTRLEDCSRRPPSHSQLLKIFNNLEFSRLIKDLHDTFPEMVDCPSAQTTVDQVSSEGYELVTRESELKKWIEKINISKSLTIDTETTSHLPIKASLVGISICVSPPEACYIPIGHISEKPQLSLQKVRKMLFPIISDPGIKKTGQNIKYDSIVLERHGFIVNGISFDTMIASHLFDPSGKHSLDALSLKFLNHKMISFKEVTSGIKEEGKFARVEIKKALEYSCEDSHTTSLLAKIFQKKLKDENLEKTFNEIEIPLIPILASMEIAGINVDLNALETLSLSLEKEIEVVAETVTELAGEKFNLNSPAQLAYILFEKLKLSPLKKTRKKTGYSTDIEVLKTLSQKHPLPAAILEFRNLTKLKNTYVDALKALVNPETGRIHTSFNQTVTATGRLSSSEPNLQNIPVTREEGRNIRKVFTAPAGSLLLSADYSQIDLRVLAHYCLDETLLKAFREKADIHTETAAEIFQVDCRLVTQEMRRAAKSVNFGIIYGMSAYGLSKELDIPRNDAEIFIERYFERYPGVKKFIKRITEQTRQKGYVTTIGGRKRFLPDINSKNRHIREFAERQAVNTPIQGSAADILKLAMIKIFDKIIQSNEKLKILLQVHDELLFEGPEDLINKTAPEIKKLMEQAMVLEVPMEVVVKTGANWAEMKKYDS